MGIITPSVYSWVRKDGEWVRVDGTTIPRGGVRVTTFSEEGTNPPLPDDIPDEVYLDPPGPPEAPANPYGGAAFEFIIMAWDLSEYAAYRTYEVYEGLTPDFVPDIVAFSNRIITTMQTVITIAHATGTGPWYEKVRSVNSRGEKSEFVPFGPYTMAEIYTSDMNAADIQAIKDEITNGTNNYTNDQITSIHNVITQDMGTMKDQAVTTAVDQIAINLGNGTTKVYAEALAAGAVDLGDDTVCVGSLAANKVAAGTIAAGTAYLGEVAAGKVVGTAADFDQALIGDLSAGKITTGSFKAEIGYLGTIGCEQLSTANAKIDIAQISDATITSLTAHEVVADKIIAAATDVELGKFGTLDAGKITTGTINALVEMTTPIIRSGKSVTAGVISTGKGFFLGLVNGTAKFLIGNATNYLSWDGTSLIVKGGNIGDSATTILGALFKTADAPARRIEMGGTLHGSEIAFYSGLVTEYTPGTIGGVQSGDTVSLMLKSPVRTQNGFISMLTLNASSTGATVDFGGATFVPAVSWTPISVLGGGWVPFTDLDYISYMRSAGGIVSVHGLIKSGSIGSVIFTLPPNSRPLKTLMLTAACGGPGVARLDIGTDGTVTLQSYHSGGTSAYLSLDSIMFSI